MTKFFTISAAALLLSSTAALAQDGPEFGAAGDVAEAGLPPVEGTDIPAAEAVTPSADAGVGAEATTHAPGHSASAPADATASADVAAPSASGATTASSDFTETQINGYVTAAMGVQELQTDATLDEAGKQERAAAILAEAGLDPSTFNAISDAVRSNPAVAEQVQLALANRRGSPGA